MADEKRATICLLVATSPESEDSHTLHKLTESALAMGHGVQIFLMNDGVYHLLRQPFFELVARGAQVTVCAHNAVERGVEERPEVLFGSQYDLSLMVAQSDAFVSFH